MGTGPHVAGGRGGGGKNTTPVYTYVNPRSPETGTEIELDPTSPATPHRSSGFLWDWAHAERRRRRADRSAFWRSTSSRAAAHGRQRRTTGTGRYGHRHHLRSEWWWWEILASALAVGCMVSLAVVLVRLHDTPLSGWDTFLQPNSLVSLLVTLAKAAIMVPAASCISQMKWLHFQRREHRIEQIQLFDDASRGPWGCLVLLWTFLFRSRGTWITVCFSLLVLLALGIDAMAQQVLEFPTKETELTNMTFGTGVASVFGSSLGDAAYSNYVSDSLFEPVDDAGLTLEHKTVLFAVRGDSVPLAFECPPPATRCAWPEMTTLAICVNSSQVPDAAVRHSCDVGRIGPCRGPAQLFDGTHVEHAPYKMWCDYNQNGSAPFCNNKDEDVFFFRSGLNCSDPGGVINSNSAFACTHHYGNISRPEERVETFTDWNLADAWGETSYRVPELGQFFEDYAFELRGQDGSPAVLGSVLTLKFRRTGRPAWLLSRDGYLTMNSTNMDSFVSVFSLCARTYSDVVWSNGDVRVGNLVSETLMVDERPARPPEEAHLELQHQNNLTDSRGRKYHASPSRLAALRFALRQSFRVDSPLGNHEADTGRFHFDGPVDLRTYGPLSLGVGRVMANVADSLTNMMRDVSNPLANPNATTVAGSGFVRETYVVVNWYWMVLPVFEVVLTVALLICTVVATREVPPLKTSAIAYLVFGLDGQASDEVQARGAAQPSVARLDADGLARLAGNVVVSLQPDEAGRLKFRKRAA